MEQKELFNGLLEILNNKLIILHDKREENPQNTLRALWHNAYGSRVLTNPDYIVPPIR